VEKLIVPDIPEPFDFRNKWHVIFRLVIPITIIAVLILVLMPLMIESLSTDSDYYITFNGTDYHCYEGYGYNYICDTVGDGIGYD
jgi:hypothetical protein